MDLKSLFYPRAIAVVGASPGLATGRMPFYQILKSSSYKGNVYPVNPSHREIDGQRVYPSLTEVPGHVDLAVCLVPFRLALETLEAAVRKGVPFVHFFTSGFSEVGNTELAESMLRLARRGGTRIVGPNCLGIHCAESGVTFDPTLEQHGRGTVGFLGQSGGVTHDFLRMASARGVGVSKAVSYGNQMDLTVEDFLEYFAQEEEIRVLAAYIEDVKNARRFLQVLKRITPAKPVIVLKGGITGQGAEAAASHTGALAGDYSIWSAAMRQCRCIEVATERQLTDAVMLAASEKIPAGTRIGYLGAGGGTSVLFTDLAASAGFSLPELSPKTRDAIGGAIPDVNTSTRNPVDMGMAGVHYKVMTHAMRALDQDDNVDFIMFYLSLDYLNLFERKRLEKALHAIGSEAGALRKPVIPILPAAGDKPFLRETRLLALSIFRGAGLSMFDGLEDAVAAIRAVMPWSLSRRGSAAAGGLAAAE
jgi:acetyl-CoA synthetase (ADP-forming)/acetyltransferase